MKFGYSHIKDTAQKKLSQTKVKVAFTLAEVLITLGIIGVVAAITIPSLINNYKAHRLSTQFLKSYSTIQQTFRQMEADDVSLDPATYQNTGLLFYKEFAKHIKYTLDCGAYGRGDGMSKAKACFNYDYNDEGKLLYGTTYKSFDGKIGFQDTYLDDGQLVLMDGTNIMFENAGYGIIMVSVDINGFQSPPNKAGYDLFTFQFNDGVLKTMGDQGTKFTDMNTYCNLKVSNKFNGIACAQKAKENPREYFKYVVKNVK